MHALAKYFIIAGSVFFIFGALLAQQRYSPQRLTFSSYTSHNTYTSLIYPKSIDITNIGIHLPIVPANMHKNNWETTDKGVSYLMSSPIPGKKGNSILYGHNWTSILGNMSQIRTGEKIWITYNDGTKKQFIVQSIAIVTPDQTHVLSDSNDVRITIYTCTGFLDSKRLVVTAIQTAGQNIL